MMTIRELGERGIVLRSIRERIDTGNATGRMIAGVLASMAELELELCSAPHRTAPQHARRARNQLVGRPKALSAAKLDQVVKLHAAGESVVAISKTFGVGRDTIYRAVREADSEADSTDTEEGS